MSRTLERVVGLIAAGEVRVSEHGYDELAADGIWARDVVAGVGDAKVIEDYPDYPKGPAVLVLQWDRERQPIHVVWGIPKEQVKPAVLVTAYRPDPHRWSRDFMRRE